MKDQYEELRKALTSRPDGYGLWEIWSQITAALLADLDALRAEVDRKNDELGSIGDYAYDNSTGPAVPDALWEIQSMAYAAVAAEKEPR